MSNVHIATAHVIERPKFLESAVRTNQRSVQIRKVADMLKMIKKTQCIKFSKEEFHKEFGENKSTKGYFIKLLKDYGIKKPRIFLDEGTYYIWSNDID